MKIIYLYFSQYGIERCTHAHSHEELEEWVERRRVLSLGDRFFFIVLGFGNLVNTSLTEKYFFKKISWIVVAIGLAPWPSQIFAALR